MEKHENSRFAQFIEEQYRLEVENEYREETTRTVTLTFSADRACMFAAIAKRFGKSVSAFGGEVFEPAVDEMFLALSPEDRLSVGKETDLELSRYLTAKGITSVDENGETPATWARYAQFCNQVDAEQGDAK